MADLDYTPVQSNSEVLNRPDQTYTVRGQAGFLAVALALRVPILSAKNNVTANSNLAASGSGLSFAVSRSTAEFRPNLAYDFANGPPTDWFKSKTHLGAFTIRRHVTKRIATSTEEGMDDARQLASITNEMRILANRTLRESPHIVTLFCVSWYEAPSYGRFWPQLLLECAEEGTLADYVKSKRLNFRTKVSLGLDILGGLNFLHIHKVVHCDLKPANILIFAALEAGEFSRFGIEPFVAKLCDFGSAVILSDYQGGDPFQYRIGSFPWMSPELDLALPIDIDLLPKSDIFSFGLVMACIFMDGTIPFDNLAPKEITNLKLVEIGSDVASAYSTVRENIQSVASFTQGQEPFIMMLLLQTLAPNPVHRFDWKPICQYLKFGLLLDLRQGNNAVAANTTPSAVIINEDLTMPEYDNLIDFIHETDFQK